MERTAVIASLSRYFAGRQDIVAAYLFGSVARGSQHASSDVDVAVLLAGRAPRSLEDHDVVFAVQDDLDLGGQVKTGQSGSLQIRPVASRGRR